VRFVIEKVAFDGAPGVPDQSTQWESNSSNNLFCNEKCGACCGKTEELGSHRLHLYSLGRRGKEIVVNLLNYGLLHAQVVEEGRTHGILLVFVADDELAILFPDHDQFVSGIEAEPSTLSLYINPLGRYHGDREGRYVLQC
jgi:hypothetical protein